MTGQVSLPSVEERIPNLKQVLNNGSNPGSILEEGIFWIRFSSESVTDVYEFLHDLPYSQYRLPIWRPRSCPGL